MMELKRGWIHRVVPNQERVIPGAPGEEASKRLRAPAHRRLQARGQAVSPSSALPPQPRACHQQPPETSPGRGDASRGARWTCHHGAAPPCRPRAGNLPSPGMLSFSLHQLPAQSREGGAPRAEKLPLFPEQMTLGQAGKSLAGIQTAQAPTPPQPPAALGSRSLLQPPPRE